MTDEREAFDPTDPFNSTVEDIRKSLTLTLAVSMEQHQTLQTLDLEKQWEAIFIATVVSCVGCLTSIVDARDHQAVLDGIRDFIPEAYRISNEIRRNGAEEGLQ